MRVFFEKNIERLLNRYLALDPESHNRLKKLENRSITIELKGINLIFQLIFSENKILFKSSDFIKADTVIKGTPLSLLSMSLTKDRKKFFSDDVTIEGNIELGQQVIDLFDALEWDWEESLSQITGDVPAYQIGRAVKSIQQFTTRLKSTIAQNINEYTHEEIDLFPPREALNDFFSDVDILRLDTDRLEARIESLIQKIMIKRGSL
jgi:ubiquinone biosynthesis protein UbiJ